MNLPNSMSPLFAEISDKMPANWQLWIFGFLAVLFICLLYRGSKLTLMVSLPLAVLIFLSTCHEYVDDSYLHSAVISELGAGYLRQVLVASALPLLCAITCSFLTLRSMRSLRLNK